MLKLTYYGNPVLRTKAKPVEKIDEEVLELIKGMEEMRQLHKGIGISAPQVNSLLRIFIVKAPIQKGEDEWIEGPTHVFINPVLSEPSEEAWEREEGCLSIPKLYGPVVRPLSITVEYLDIEGKPLKNTFHGWEARVIMHENDHLNGVLFIDRLPKDERKRAEPILKEIKKKYS